MRKGDWDCGRETGFLPNNGSVLKAWLQLGHLPLSVSSYQSAQDGCDVHVPGCLNSSQDLEHPFSHLVGTSKRRFRLANCVTVTRSSGSHRRLYPSFVSGFNCFLRWTIAEQYHCGHDCFPPHFAPSGSKPESLKNEECSILRGKLIVESEKCVTLLSTVSARLNHSKTMKQYTF